MPFKDSKPPAIIEKIKNISERDEMKLGDFRLKSIGILLSSGMIGAASATGLAFVPAEGGNKIWEYFSFQVDGIEDPSKRPEELKAVDKRLEEISKERKDLGKVRSALRRFFKSSKENNFPKDTIPFLKMKKMWLESNLIIKDVMYWSMYASWWLTFFSLITTILYKYRNGVVLKKGQVEIANDVKDIGEFIIQLGNDLQQHQKVMELALEEIRSKGTLSESTINRMKKIEEVTQPMIDELEEEGIIELSSWSDEQISEVKNKQKSLLERLKTVKKVD